MKNKILWIDDDVYTIKGLVRPIQKSGYTIEEAKSASEGFLKVPNWRKYDLIILDLILPLSMENEQIPEQIKEWKSATYIGISFLKWIILDMKIICPVLILSIVDEQVSNLDFLIGVKNVYHISKRGLLPSELKSKILEILNQREK